MPISRGAHLGRYEILGGLGAGGMGEVYRARDEKLQREVAIKLLPDAMADDAAALERFRRGARVASAVQHPGICTVYDVDEDGGRPYIVMELAQGQTLGEKLGRRPLPSDTLVDLAISRSKRERTSGADHRHAVAADGRSSQIGKLAGVTPEG
jgi:serine/threonine protein kinase